MVYKKIGDKVPSLSSLLLAGALLGGCTETKNETQSNVTSPEKNTPEGKSSTKGDVEGGLHYNLAAKRSVYKVLLQASDLGYLRDEYGFLDASKVKDFKVIEEFLSDRSGRLSANNPLKKQFTALHNACSKEALASLVEYPSEWAEAIKAMLQPFNALRSVYEGIQDYPSGAQKDVMLRKNLDLARKGAGDLESGGVLMGSGSAKKAKKTGMAVEVMKNGPRLARFMTDKTRTDNSKFKEEGSRYGIPELLEENVAAVWVKGRSKGEPAYLSTQRGGSIDDHWKVENSSTTMPRIPEIDNRIIAPKLNLDRVKDKLTGMGWLSDSTLKRSEEGLLDGLKNLYAERQDGKCSPQAVVPLDITYGTLLFTLFKGTGSFDFLNLVMGDDGNSVASFSGKEDVYEGWVALINDANGFARRLGQHIVDNKDLSLLFEIPKAQSLVDRITRITDKISSDTDSGKAMLAVICTNIARELGMVEDTAIVDEPFKGKGGVFFMDMLSSLDFEKSDATFDQRVLLYVAKKLFEYPEGRSSVTKDELISQVKRWVSEKVDNHAILQQDEKGGFVPTAVTHWICKLIKRFDEGLYKKARKEKVFTYANIEKVAKGFKVEEIQNAINDAFGMLTKLLDVNLDNPKKPIGESTFSPIKLSPERCEEINKILEDDLEEQQREAEKKRKAEKKDKNPLSPEA